MPALYDEIGNSYSRFRRPDPRIAAVIGRALEGCASVLSVGAGTGSYEPAGRTLLAIEPSRTMIAQRAAGSAPAVQAVAESLPVAAGSFDAALAVLTVHHWPDVERGFAEMRRVAHRQVVVTWDPAVSARYWLVAEYLPQIALNEASAATLDTVVGNLQKADVRTLAVPWDCRDGFLAAYWRRPERYLDPEARAAISGLALLDEPTVAGAMERLADDLASGAWQERHRDLLGLQELDAGYRLVVGHG
jgi:SAM-dependent methyltransferase